MQSGVHWGQIMDASLQRRLNVASCWASSRIAVLDCLERYEDSYAVMQEFQEWIACLGEDPKHLEGSFLKVPTDLLTSLEQTSKDIDEILEI